MNSKNSLVIVVGLLVLILAAAGVGYAVLGGSKPAGQTMQDGTASTAASATATAAPGSGADGSASTGSTSNVGDASANGSANAADPSATNSAGQTATEVLNGGMGEATLKPMDFVVPEFVVLDQEGTQVTLSSTRGKPTLLSYWATWCPPCMQETPVIQALHDKYSDQINLLMVNVTDGTRETVEGVTEWYAAQDYTYPIYFDTSGQAAAAGNVRYLPTAYFLDRDGNVMYAEVGSLTEEGAGHIIDALLSME